MDVRLTRDEFPVILHDATLSRTSNIDQLSGHPFDAEKRVSHLSLEALRQLDMGSWFLDHDPFRTISSGKIRKNLVKSVLPQRISTLFEVLDWAAAHALPVNVELKDIEDREAGSVLVNAVMADIMQADMTDKVLISSFNHQYLQQCRRKNHRIATAALVEGRHPENLIAYLKGLGVIAYHPAENMVDGNLVAELHRHDIQLNVYTVNDKDRKKELFELGVDSVFTDFPE